MIKADGMAPGDTVAQAPTVAPTPEKNEKIIICHWNNSGSWNQIEISINGLNGHDNHRFDIWPPVEGETDGQNWRIGENVYLNGCETTDHPGPSPSPTVTVTPTPTPSVTDTVTPNPSVTATQSLPPQPTETVTVNPSVTATQPLPPQPTETVTATATATATPTPEPCPTPTVVSEAMVAIPLVGLIFAAGLWQHFRPKD